MPPEVNIISFSRDSVQHKLNDSIQAQTNTVVFNPNDSIQPIGDTVSISRKEVNIEKAEKKEEKFSNTKKWLIAAGITVGVIAIGAATYYITKKPPSKIAGDLPKTLAKIDDFEVFKGLKMCKNLSLNEKELAHKILIKNGNKNIFLGVLSGDKPASLLSAITRADDSINNPLDILKKLDLGNNIEWVRANNWNTETVNFFNEYMINKKCLSKIIKNNKNIYTSQLDIDKTSSVRKIYEALINYSKNNDGLPDDLLGISLGFPKYDSMIYHLEGIYNLRQERLSPDFTKKLLEVFYKDDFPYKNIDKKTLENLMKSIKNINQENLKDIAIKGSYSNGLYDFINFCDDTNELERISKMTTNFVQTFNAT